MAHAQQPDFVFRRNGRVHLNRQGRQFSRLLAAEVCARAVSGSNAGCTMFRGSVKGTGYTLHSRVSPSLPPRASPCAITFQLDSTYNIHWDLKASVLDEVFGFKLWPPSLRGQNCPAPNGWMAGSATKAAFSHLRPYQ